MSRILEIVTARPIEHPELRERLASWLGEAFPRDPREFTLDGIRLVVGPTPEHVRALLPSTFGSAPAALSLDERVLLAWSAARLSSGDEARLARLFEIVTSAPDVAVVHEAGEGTGARVSHVKRAELFRAIDAVVKGPGEHDLTVLIPDG